MPRNDQQSINLDSVHALNERKSLKCLYDEPLQGVVLKNPVLK
jgi:hypothetical protein